MLIGRLIAALAFSLATLQVGQHPEVPDVNKDWLQNTASSPLQFIYSAKGDRFLVENVSRGAATHFFVGCVTRQNDGGRLERRSVLPIHSTLIAAGTALALSVNAYSTAKDTCGEQKQNVGVTEVDFSDGGRWCLGSCRE